MPVLFNFRHMIYYPCAFKIDHLMYCIQRNVKKKNEQFLIVSLHLLWHHPILHTFVHFIPKTEVSINVLHIQYICETKKFIYKCCCSL